MNMVKSHLLSRNTLSSTIVGVIPREPADDSQVAIIVQCNIGNHDNNDNNRMTNQDLVK